MIKQLENEGYDFIKKQGQGGQSNTSLLKKNDLHFLLKQPLNNNLSKEQRFRFKQETQALLMLDGAGAPKIIQYDFEGPEPYILMEFINGRTLSQFINGKPISEDKALIILENLILIINRTHSLGLLHRDIKPDNIIILEDLRVVLIDFGLCRIEINDREYITPDDKELGNRFLRLPELGKGEKLSSSVSDVTFIIGLLFYMITAQQPNLLLDEKNQAPHNRPYAIDILKDKKLLRNIFDRGFSYSIGQRFQTAQEILDYIKKINNTTMSEDSNYLIEYEDYINSHDYKNLNLALEFVITAHKEYIQGIHSSLGKHFSYAGSGPNVDSTGYTVVSDFFLVPNGRSHPQVRLKLNTKVEEDLNYITHHCDFRDSTKQTGKYSIAEKERILDEYKSMGESRAIEAIKDLIEIVKSKPD